jgi:uncharacterized protein
MLIVISPAKTLDFETQAISAQLTTPDFFADADQLVQRLQRLSPKKLSALMDISADLAQLNFDRYASWQDGASPSRVKPALLAFQGDVYQGMQAANFTGEDLDYAQHHLRILSGLYGLLRPLDQIQPYRLEMGTRLKIGRKTGLYHYWGLRIAQALSAALDAQGDRLLINLASEEYFDAVDLAALQARVIKPVFLDEKGGKYKVVSFWAKRARGMMTAYILQNRIQDPIGIQSFEGAGYRFNPVLSEGDVWAFTRSAADLPQP